MPPLGTSVRLCLKDLYSQDVVEMIDRETRKYEVESIEHPDHPDYARAYEILWNFVKTLSGRLRDANDKMAFMTVTARF